MLAGRQQRSPQPEPLPAGCPITHSPARPADQQRRGTGSPRSLPFPPPLPRVPAAPTELNDSRAGGQSMAAPPPRRHCALPLAAPPPLPKTPLPRSPELFFLINLAAARPGCLVEVNDITDPRRGGPQRPPPPPRVPLPHPAGRFPSPGRFSPLPPPGGGGLPRIALRPRPAPLRPHSSGQRRGARGVAGYRECRGAKAVLCGGGGWRGGWGYGGRVAAPPDPVPANEPILPLLCRGRGEAGVGSRPQCPLPQHRHGVGSGPRTGETRRGWHLRVAPGTAGRGAAGGAGRNPQNPPCSRLSRQPQDTPSTPVSGAPK